MNLSIRQIATFREVMLSGSISQAARALGRTQPAVSMMIGQLESEVGFPLFVREQGKLRPTPEARYFLEECEAILARLERTRLTLGRIRALETGKLRIACHPAASALFMPRLLTGFLDSKADVEVALVMRSSGVIEDLIASQQYDIGFAETPVRRASIAQTDFDLECVCLLPVDDPLAGADALGPQDLDGKPMAMLFGEHATARQTEAAFRAAGRRLNRRLELRTFLPGLEFVHSGFCYMICDMITAYSHVLQTDMASRIAIRRFRPRICSAISILAPGYAAQTLLAQAFSAHLAEAVHAMRRDMNAAIGGAP